MARGKNTTENKANGAASNGRSRKIARSVSENADWETVDGQILLKAIGTITASGGAIRLGYTSDGGAYALGIYGDGDPYTEYFRALSELEKYLEQVITSW